MVDTIDNEWFFRRGALAADGWQAVVDSSIPGWQHTGLRVADLSDGASISLTEVGVERLVIPLAGSFRVAHSDGRQAAATHGPATDSAATQAVPTTDDVIHLHGRTSVFDGPTDVLYVPASDTLTISGQGRVAIASARTDVVKPVQYIPAADTPIELRGAGNCSRQIHNFGTPQALDAARIIVCEVITPAGNFSSYPPHKHDEHVPGHESRLEEIYYFELAGPVGPDAQTGAGAADNAIGMFATYSSPAGDIATNAIVHTGDIALVPFGFHGPAAALPGYNMYYLNVMAGPDPEREWLISDDPAQTWVRDLWEGEPVDPRLPLARAEQSRSEQSRAEQ